MTDKTVILVVEDDADIAELMKIFLEADGYGVDIARDGVDALARLRDGSPPALIILDLMMPRLDGEQFLRQIRRTRFANIPVVVMSGHSTAKEDAEELHAVSCLMKPVEADELLRTVRQFAPHAPGKNVA